jgi:signal transduction histidine kinase
MVSVDLNAVVQETVELANMEAQLRNCRLKIEFSRSLPAVVIDPIHIQQVALNLIRNAIEASEDVTRENEKVVLVRTTKTDTGHVEVSVADSGLGVTDMEGDRLFEPFFSTKRSGLGMGLSVCQSIIAMHDGKIWHTQNPAGGTIFHFSLPLDSEEGAA